MTIFHGRIPDSTGAANFLYYFSLSAHAIAAFANHSSLDKHHRWTDAVLWVDLPGDHMHKLDVLNHQVTSHN